jgi:phospholipid/cholesterol/gamma-HCH transport system ATP-binding protein
MTRVEGVFKSFGDNKVLKGASVEFSSGKIVGLIGPSGCGKSTLLKILGAVLSPDEGAVADVGRVSLMFQEGALFDSVTVADNVAFPVVNGEVPTYLLSSPRREEVEDLAISALGTVGLTKAAAKYPGQLSGGMRKRAALARALVQDVDLYLLDDPTAGLDPVASSVIMKLIVDAHAAKSGTTIVVSHDLRRLLPICDQIVAMEDGKVVFTGDLNQLKEFKNESLRHFVSCRFELN